jgi:hypothetical protein
MRGLFVSMLAAAGMIAVGVDLRAETRLRSDALRPHSDIVVKDLGAPSITGTAPSRGPETESDTTAAAAPGAASPEIITDVARLPPPVARMRARILAAARTGRLEELVAVMRANETMPIFSLGDDADPTMFWRSSFPESGGVEVLATLIEIIEAGFVHVEEGTPQEMYLWPYFARVPIKSLSPEQKVQLLRLVTGSDYKDMLASGSYTFYRLGIGSDGAWRFFVAGD